MSARGRRGGGGGGQPSSSPRGKPTILKRDQGRGSSGPSSHLLLGESTTDGSGRHTEEHSETRPAGYGAPPRSIRETAPQQPPQQPLPTSAFGGQRYEAAPSVQPPKSAFASVNRNQMRAQEEARRAADRTTMELMSRERFHTEDMSRYAPKLKMVVCSLGAKKLAALVETDDKNEIKRVEQELSEDMKKYDGRSNVPVSTCSLPFLEKRQIEYLSVLHTQFPWAPYYCSLCDFHISDILAADGHLPHHMKEEKRLHERQSLPARLPPLSPHQLAAIERVLVDAAVMQCRADREQSLRASAVEAMDSLRKLCQKTKFSEGEKGINLWLHGSLVSGLLTDKSDINIVLAVDGETTKFFVDRFLTAMEQAADWSVVKLVEAPTGHARIRATFSNEAVTIDWQNCEGVRFSQILSMYNRLHEDLLQLRQIVYHWAEVCDLTTEEKLSSQHAVPRVLLDIMLIHALQQSDRLPCIHEIRSRTGKDIYDDDLEDVMSEMSKKPFVRWNYAEAFLDFLYYFSKGDVKQFLVQITQVEKVSKSETKFSRKQLNVFDPIRRQPIAALHKTFLCYFINCFLTTYVHYRIPRMKKDNGVEALVEVDVFQTASQSPQKKKGARREDQKEKGDENEAAPSSSDKKPAAANAPDRPADATVSEALAVEIPSYEKPIVIHGKQLERMQPKDFEVDGDLVYSRQAISTMKHTYTVDKNVWDLAHEVGINVCYLPPDDFEEPTSSQPPIASSQGTPQGTPTTTKKRRARRKNGKGDASTQDEEREGNESAENAIEPCTPSVGQSTARVLKFVEALDGTSPSSNALSQTLPSIPASDSHKKKRVSKLIKIDSADSSELSCEPSPTVERKDILSRLADLAITQPSPSTVQNDAVPDLVKVEDDDAGTETKMEEESAGREQEAGEDEEIVLPDSNAPGLQPTFEELYIELKEYDLDKISKSLAHLGEEDYCYSFDTASLTAGFKCDQHCSACDSPKHLVTACPQLKVPPVREISRTHWKPHFSCELDRIICMTFDSEKITPGRRKELMEVKTRLNNAIQKKLRSNGFRLDAFGSSENGFGSNKSDFDVCFRYADNPSGIADERSQEKQMETILTIENALRYARFNRVMSITTAKVPIVKFATRLESGGEIEGDISYYNELALHNTQLLKRYCSWTKDEVLSKLGMFIKRWAKQCDIGDASKGSLSSYAYIILLIHFLQRVQPNPLLPVLQEIGDKQVVQVDGWDVYFCDDQPKPDWSQCSLSVGELFLQFLDYFSKFDWHNQVVQIRQSNKLSKIERGWRKLMCIEDPFDLDHNLGSGISNRMFAFIMKSFVTSREVFFALKERVVFMKRFGESAEFGADLPIADSFIAQYGCLLLGKCRSSIGGAPRDRQCFKCGRIGHFSDACPTQSSGFARRGDGGRGGGARGGGGGKDDRAGNATGPPSARRDEHRGGGDRPAARREEHRYRDQKKERLALQRESFRAERGEKL